LEKGVSFAKSKIEEILGIKIPYWIVVNFTGFKEIIDTLGGIKVNVDVSFTDCKYPTDNPHRDICVSFKAGPQMMNGETALKYARSRKGSINGDYDRVRRQQKIILAVEKKILSFSLLLNPGKLNELYRQFSSAVRTNATLGEVEKALELAVKMGNLSNVQNFVIDPASGLVYPPASTAPYGGMDVVIPKAGVNNFSKIQEKIHQLLFGTPQTVTK
jgi:LCP family protein required for cell wall assembly